MGTIAVVMGVLVSIEFTGIPARGAVGSRGMTEYVLGDLMIYAVFVVLVIACMADYRWRHDCRARERREKGLCTRCGYNLAFNTSGICPECGTPVRP